MLKKCLYQIPKHYDRIEVFEGNVKYLSQLLSLRKVFNFQANVCNSKSEAKNVMQNIDLTTEKPGTLWNKKLFYNI